MIQAKTGVNLKQTGIVDPHHLKKLSALSITTIEELMNLTQEARSFMVSFLENLSIYLSIFLKFDIFKCSWC